MTLVPVTEDPFALAERIAKSNLVPAAYRNKPTDLAIAVMYGRELGLPPMTSLQRVVVINGKPTLDAQGFVSLIRAAGHSLSGEVDSNQATVVGKRGDTGDTMTVTFTMADAERADLLKNATYRKFPTDMLWARAVTQLARRLFADVMLSVSYAPEEMQEVVGSNGHAPPEQPPAPPLDRSRTVRPAPGAPTADAETGEIIDAEVVEESRLDVLKHLIKEAGYTPEEGHRVIDSTIGRDTTQWEDLSVEEIEQMIGFLTELESGQQNYSGEEEPF